MIGSLPRTPLDLIRFWRHRAPGMAGKAVAILLAMTAVSSGSLAADTVVGIGRISSSYDGSSDAFDLWAFLQKAKIRSKLVDNVTDAKIVVTGDIDSTYASEGPEETLGGTVAAVPIGVISIVTTMGIAPVPEAMSQEISFSHRPHLRVYVDGRQLKRPGMYPIEAGSASISGELEIEFMMPNNAWGAVSYSEEYFQGLAKAREESLEGVWALVVERLKPILNPRSTR